MKKITLLIALFAWFIAGPRVLRAQQPSPVKVQEGIGEGNQNEEADKPPHVKTRSATGGCESLLNSKPDHHDGCECEHHVNSKGLN